MTEEPESFCEDYYESFLFRARMMAFAEYSNLHECLIAIIDNPNERQVWKDFAKVALERGDVI